MSFPWYTNTSRSPSIEVHCEEEEGLLFQSECPFCKHIEDEVPLDEFEPPNEALRRYHKKTVCSGCHKPYLVVHVDIRESFS